MKHFKGAARGIQYHKLHDEDVQKVNMLKGIPKAGRCRTPLGSRSEENTIPCTMTQCSIVTC